MSIKFEALITSANRSGKGKVGPIDFGLPSGSILGIYGPSGIGKSTLLRAIVDGPGADDLMSGTAQLAGRAGYVPQNPVLSGGLTLTKFLTTIADGDDQSELLKRLAISDLGERKLQQLSGGEKQRATLAAAILSQPDHLVLDEPFSALDHKTKIHTAHLLSDLVGAKEIDSIVLASHDIDALIVCSDHLMVLKLGVGSTSHEINANPIRRTGRLAAIQAGEVALVRTEILG